MQPRPDDVTPRPQQNTSRGDSPEVAQSQQPDEPSGRGDTPASETGPARGRPGRHREPPQDWTMQPADHTRITAGGEPSRGDPIEKIRRGPGHSQEVDELVRDRMDEESPDGAPPTLAGRRESRMLFVAVWAVVWIVVLTIAYFIGGWRLAALVLVLTTIYIGYAAWPTWRAGLDRRTDEQRAEREVEMEGRRDAPADRQPPVQDR